VSGKTTLGDFDMWIFLGGIGVVLYIALWITLGLMTLRKGHWFMFICGFFFPLFWIIGALIPPVRTA
jgi:hypothetical protein